MKHGVQGVLIILSSILSSSCEKYTAHSNRVVIIQPFADFSTTLTKKTYNEVRAVNSEVILKPAIALPKQAYYAPRNRYRAEKLLSFLSDFGNADTVMIGLTSKDISTSKGSIKDWGIMGLGYCPGNACVVSTFRLKKTNLHAQFYKLVLHELGHTQGLDHCSNKACFMRDAQGGNPLDQEKDFCTVCKPYLKKKGWKF